MDWNDYRSLGRALNDAYPETNYLTLADADLRGLVVALPGFDGPPSPPDGTALSAIRFAWIGVAEGEDDAGPGDGAT